MKVVGDFDSMLYVTQCTTAPFLRVAKAWVPDDQSIPSNVRRSIDSRDEGTTGNSSVTVHALTLDTNFGAMDVGK